MFSHNNMRNKNMYYVIGTYYVYERSNSKVIKKNK